MSRITVRTENKRFPTAPNLYGIFFEDINRAGDGGLYPELLILIWIPLKICWGTI